MIYNGKNEGKMKGSHLFPSHLQDIESRNTKGRTSSGFGFLFGEVMISVIVPYKDAAKWIERCAKSLKQQTGDFEFIFVDDHSKDNGEEILREIADSRFMLMKNHHHPGVSGARNTGLDIARGDWITFLDADDELMRGACDKFAEAIKTKASIHQFNHVRHYITKPAMNINRSKYDNPPGMYDIRKLPEIWFGVWNKLYKRELIESVRFDESMQYGEDEMFNLECLSRTDEIHCGNGTTVRHNIENMKSLSHVRTDADLIREVQKLGDFIITHKDKRLRSVVYDLMIMRLSSRWYRKAICG